VVVVVVLLQLTKMPALSNIFLFLSLIMSAELIDAAAVRPGTGTVRSRTSDLSQQDDDDGTTSKTSRATKVPKKSKYSNSPYVIPKVSPDTDTPADKQAKATELPSVNTTEAIDDKNLSVVEDSASEWDLRHNESSALDILFDMSSKTMNGTLVLPAEPDTSQSTTVAVISIFSFLALVLCVATACQRCSNRRKRQGYQEVANLVV
jgi:hypothetical protein